jgi:hypothetical protein
MAVKFFGEFASGVGEFQFCNLGVKTPLPPLLLNVKIHRDFIGIV